MGKLHRQLHSKRARTRHGRDEYSLIGGGLVSLETFFCRWQRIDVFLLGNTRVISQKALDHFRTSLAGKKDDPYSVLLRRNKLPMALLDDAANPNLRKVSSLLPVKVLDHSDFHVCSVPIL